MKPVHASLRVIAFVAIVLFVAGGLSLVIATVEREQNAPRLQTIAVIVPTSTEPEIPGQLGRTSCEADGGRWVDCGDPCHGKSVDACPSGGVACEPQCLCGGTSAWTCPTNFSCADIDATSTVGVCRSSPPPAPLPAVAPGMICGDNHLICISSSAMNDTLTNPFVVTGTARVFENQFAWKLQDAAGALVGSGNLMASSSPDETAAPSFRLRAFLITVPKSASGTLTLYEPSAKDGTPVNVLRVPVSFPEKTTDVTIVIPKDLDAWNKAAIAHAQIGWPDPLTVVPLTIKTITIPKTILPMEATLDELLHIIDGPLHLDAGQLDVVSFAFADHAAHVTLAMDRDGWPGVSSAQAAVRPLVEKTLMKFPGVMKVVFGE